MAAGGGRRLESTCQVAVSARGGSVCHLRDHHDRHDRAYSELTGSIQDARGCGSYRLTVTDTDTDTVTVTVTDDRPPITGATTGGPMFRTRRSPSPDQHHDQHEHDLGLRHDLAVMNRRSALRGILGAAGVGVVGLSVGCASGSESGGTPGDAAAAGVGDTSSSSSPSSGSPTDAPDAACVDPAPGETAGPYPGDGSNGPNVLVESGVHRSDITTSFNGMTGTAEGVPMRLTMTLQDLPQGCTPGEGMAVYVWQCDREGRYSLYSEGVLDQNYLRGVQTADGAGRVEFTSIVPACYPGRWPHVHFEVYDTLASAVAGENARLTSQIALPAGMCQDVYADVPGYSASVANLAALSLETDMVFADGWDTQMPTVTGSPEAGYEVAITIGVASREDNAETGPGGPGGSRGPDGQAPPPRPGTL